MNEKRAKYISALAVLLIVVAVFGASYAMFSFNASGTKENVINSGNVDISFKNATSINLTKVYPLTDAVGAAGTDPNSASMEFDVTSKINGTMTIYYDLYLKDITPGATLTSNYVKFNLKRTLADGTESYVLGSESTGVTVASLVTKAGQYVTMGNAGSGTGITGYAIDSNSTATNETVHYKLTAWVADGFTYNNTKTSVEGCSKSTYTTEADCKANGGVWGSKQSSTTGDAETFSFKVAIKAVQGT